MASSALFSWASVDAAFDAGRRRKALKRCATHLLGFVERNPAGPCVGQGKKQSPSDGSRAKHRNVLSSRFEAIALQRFQKAQAIDHVAGQMS